MLTALNIEEFANRRGLRGVLSRLRRNRVRVEHLYCDSAAVRSVVYEHRRSRISWSMIDRFVGTERRRVLCPHALTLSASDGYRRFADRGLSRRMCENAALWLLHEARDQNVRVALIDRDGERADLCRWLTQDTDSLLVLTARPQFYLREADRMLEEHGAVIRVSADADLSDADLIIAPDALTSDVGCADDALILSGVAPNVRQRAPVIYEWIFDLADKYRAICPPYLDEMYFAAALYSLGGIHELGSEVFRRCYDGTVLHTRMSLLAQLRERLARREFLDSKS